MWTWISIFPQSSACLACLVRATYMAATSYPTMRCKRRKAGVHSLTSLKTSGWPTAGRVPRTQDIWVGINRLRQMLPRFSFRIPQCDRGLEALSNYHTVRETSTGIARDEPCHDWSSHAAVSLRVISECEAAGMLRNLGSSGPVRRPATTVLTGFRGDVSERRDHRTSVLDQFFGPDPAKPIRVIR